MITIEWTDADGRRQRREFPKSDGVGKLRKRLRRQGITDVYTTYSSGSPYRGLRNVVPRHQPDPRVWAGFKNDPPVIYTDTATGPRPVGEHSGPQTPPDCPPQHPTRATDQGRPSGLPGERQSTRLFPEENTNAHV